MEEKNETQLKEENSINADNSVNDAQDFKNEQEQFPVMSNIPCADTGEVSQNKAESGVEAQIKDNVENCVENGTNEKTVNEPKKVDDILNNETAGQWKEIWNIPLFFNILTQSIPWICS